MRKITVVNGVTLDGVMQAPARPDEDTRGGFKYGGWAVPYTDAVMAGVMGSGMYQGGALLFGRRTYEDFYSVWPTRKDNPYTPVLNNSQKYVASTTLQEPLPWSNSTLLKGDAAETVATLKQQPGKDIVILGSGALIQTLMRHNLIDEYLLSIYPLVLGSGRHLFPDGCPYADLQLINTTISTTDVILATYRPADKTADNTH